MHNDTPFTFAEAFEAWARIVTGWARRLDASGGRAWLEGQPNGEDGGGSYEAVTRMLWGLGGWLSRPERSAVIARRGERLDLEALARQALVSGTDPLALGFWGWAPDDQEANQRTVESGQVAFFAWQTRERIWARMAEHERANVVAWLDRFGRRPGAWNSNWALFWALNHASRKALGARYDQATIDSALDYLEGVYCGDGWYDDATSRGRAYFDDYNLWVFATHVLAWAECDGASQPERRERLLGRITLLMGHLPYFFAADGAYPEYGRSLSYKFARLGALLWAYRLGAWPHSPGLLRRIVGRHLRWYLDRGALRGDGTLRQSLTAGGSLAVRESYISTGAVYWAMLAFGALWALTPDDPFWTAEEQPLPAEQVSFVRALQQPGWLLVGGRNGVQRFVAGSTGHYPAKYDKFVYATAAPFNVGLAEGAPGPDSMLCLTDGREIGHRSGSQRWALDEAGWLRMRYHQQLGGGSHAIDTTIVVRGDLHIRAHRITLDPAARAPIGAIEGCGPLGYAPGDQPQVQGDQAAGWEAAGVHGRMVALARLTGYDDQQRAAAWQGRSDLNAVHAEYLLPVLRVTRLSAQHELVCLAYAGPATIDPATLAAQVAAFGWRDGGAFELRWSDGEQVRVPPLAE
jgi:hypothetical protein